MWMSDETEIDLPNDGPVCHRCFERLRSAVATDAQRRRGAETANARR